MNDTAERQATRRRWINLAELVGVAGVIIAACSLWLTWSDRRSAEADKAASAVATAKEKGRLELSATVEGGHALRLSDARHDLTDVAIGFPAALGVATQRPSGDLVIEAKPFAGALLKLGGGGPDERAGRLPVLITASYVDGDTPRAARGLYDVTWRTHGRILRGRVLELTGLRLRQRGGDQKALDALWAKEKR